MAVLIFLNLSEFIFNINYAVTCCCLQLVRVVFKFNGDDRHKPKKLSNNNVIYKTKNYLAIIDS